MKKIPKKNYPGSFPPAGYFLVTVMDMKKTRLRLLPFQYRENPTDPEILLEVNTDWNVSADKADRAKYPMGTVFYCEGLHQQIGHYDATGGGVIYAVENLADYNLDPATKSLIRTAWEQYEVIQRSLSSAATPEEVVEVVTYFSKLQKNRRLKTPTIENDGFYIEEDQWYYLVRNMKKQLGTLICGPTGTAKTKVAYLLAERTGMDLLDIDMGTMTDPVSGLLGVHRLEGNRSLFDPAPFIHGIQKEGFILLDELSRAPATANNILLPALDSRRKISLAYAGSGEEREIKLHEGCSIIATANLGVDYAGTNELDLALKTRFHIIEFSYLPPDIEVKLLTKVTGVAAKVAKEICSVANTIRNEYFRGTLTSPVSTRETLEAAQLVVDGFAVRKSMMFMFLPMFEGSAEEANTERSTVKAFIDSANSSF